MNTDGIAMDASVTQQDPADITGTDFSSFSGFDYDNQLDCELFGEPLDSLPTPESIQGDPEQQAKEPVESVGELPASAPVSVPTPAPACVPTPAADMSPATPDSATVPQNDDFDFTLLDLSFLDASPATTMQSPTLPVQQASPAMQSPQLPPQQAQSPVQNLNQASKQQFTQQFTEQSSDQAPAQHVVPQNVTQASDQQFTQQSPEQNLGQAPAQQVVPQNIHPVADLQSTAQDFNLALDHQVVQQSPIQSPHLQSAPQSFTQLPAERPAPQHFNKVNNQQFLSHSFEQDRRTSQLLLSQALALQSGQQNYNQIPQQQLAQQHTNQVPQQHFAQQNHTLVPDQQVTQQQREQAAEAYLRDLGSNHRVYPDLIARQEISRVGITDDEETNYHYRNLTHRAVCIADGSPAYSRGYWPYESRSAYCVPPASNPNYPNDVTSVNPHHYGLTRSSAANPPLLISWIEEPRGMVIPHPKSLTPCPLLDEHSKPVQGINGDYLRDFKLLPRYISSAVEGWRMHYWLTLDKRIKYSDIIARMHHKCTLIGGTGPLAGGIGQVTSMLKARVDRFRREAGILAPLTQIFDPETYEVTAADVQVVSKLTRAQHAFGTWWVVDTDKGIMYPPRPADPTVPWQQEQYLLPECGNPSLRVQCILQHMSSLRNASMKRAAEQAAQTSSPKRPYTVPRPTPAPSPSVATPRQRNTSNGAPATTPAGKIATPPPARQRKKPSTARTRAASKPSSPLANPPMTPEGLLAAANSPDLANSIGGSRQYQAYLKHLQENSQ